MLGGQLSEGIAASDVIRSMMRSGFTRDEIYDLLTGIGVGGEQVQLLIDRVAHEFHEAGIEPRPSRLASEMERLIREVVEDLRHETLTRLDSLAFQLELIKTELEKLRVRVAGIKPIAEFRASSKRGKRLGRLTR